MPIIPFVPQQPKPPEVDSIYIDMAAAMVAEEAQKQKEEPEGD